jgi:outer membrane lipoprotein LolB
MLLCRVGTKIVGGRWWLWLALCAVLAGCTSGVRTVPPLPGEAGHWQGRLAVKVTHPEPKAFATQFDLHGNAAQGQLTLSTPLGTTLAKLQWTEDAAFLTTTGAPQRFDSMQALALSATGVDIPVKQLFDWFGGVATATPGWEADLREFGSGRITAKRAGTDLQAELKILLDQ